MHARTKGRNLLRWFGLFIVLPYMFGCTSGDSALDKFELSIECLKRPFAWRDPVQNISYDVRKTDSLVSPFVGQLKFERPSLYQGDVLYTVSYEVDLAFQDEKWLVKRVQSKVEGNSWKEEDKYGYSNVEHDLGLGLGVDPASELKARKKNVH